MLRPFALLLLVTAIACESAPDLPEDLAALMKIADHADFSVAVPAAQKVAQNFGENGVYQLVEKGGGNARGWGCALLVGYPSERARNTLTAALRDSSPHVRLQAMIGLATVCGNDCLAEIKSLQGDPDPEVRRVQAETVQKLQSSR
jgi:HEAT repeat protein